MSKKLLMAMLILVASCLVNTAMAGEQQAAYYIVKIKDHDSTSTYEVMTPAEFLELRARVNLESKLLPKAYDQVKKEWRKNAKEGRPKSLPISRPRPRRVLKQSSAATSEKADKKLAKYEEKGLRERKRVNRKSSDELRNMSENRRKRYEKREALEADALRMVLDKLKELVEAELSKKEGGK